MLHLRLATSTVLIAVSVGLLWLDHRYPTGAICLLPLLLFFAVGTSIDMTRLWAAAAYPINRWCARECVFLVIAFAYVPLLWEFSGKAYPADCPIGRVGWIAIGVIVSACIAIAVEMVTFHEDTRGAVQRIQATAFISLYVGACLSMLVVVRGMGSSHWGLAALISLIATTKVSDAGAYITGRLIGRNKLIPRLSPGKTIEGALGGIAFSIAISYAMFAWLMPWLTESQIDYPWWGPVVFGGVCASVGMFGDLAESLMKRATGSKDSGDLLPGMGGVWDVTDSLIATALPGYLCLLGGVAGPIL